MDISFSKKIAVLDCRDEAKRLSIENHCHGEWQVSIAGEPYIQMNVPGYMPYEPWDVSMKDFPEMDLRHEYVGALAADKRTRLEYLYGGLISLLIEEFAGLISGHTAALIPISRPFLFPDHVCLRNDSCPRPKNIAQFDAINLGRQSCIFAWGTERFPPDARLIYLGIPVADALESYSSALVYLFPVAKVGLDDFPGLIFYLIDDDSVVYDERRHDRAHVLQGWRSFTLQHVLTDLDYTENIYGG